MVNPDVLDVQAVGCRLNRLKEGSWLFYRRVRGAQSAQAYAYKLEAIEDV